MLHLELEDTLRRTSVMFGDSAWEVVNFLRNPPADERIPFSHREFADKVRTSRHYGMTGTHGCSYEEALQLVIEGWQEGVDMMHRGLETLIGVNAPGISRWRNDVAGEQPDIYRAIAGDPRDMKRRAFNKGGKPVVHIVVNTAMQGFATDKQTTNYGIALLGLIDYLESRGRRVELDRLGVVTGHGGQAKSGRSMQGWKVKHAEEPADLAAIAFALAHPASHRKLVWSMRAYCKAVVPAGGAAKITQNDAELIGAGHAFLIDSVGDDGKRCNTPQEALILAGERLNKAAGEQLVDVSELKVEA